MNRYFLITFFTIISFCSFGQHQYPTKTVDGQKFYQYEVKSGEGLYSVSRTFSLPVDQIVKYNPSVKEGLMNGQVLLIPIIESEAKPLSDQNSVFYHTIERGETVYSLAAMYNTSPDEIYKLNPAAKEGIREGAVLEIPQRRIISKEKEENYRYHTIAPKETLYSVARTYSLTPQDVVAANSGLSTKTFRIGKTIRIPFFESNETFTSYEGPVKIEQTQHKVAAGETLYSIAQKYNTTVEEIEKQNPGVSSSQLSTRTVLTIPQKKIDKELARQDAVQESKANVLLSKSKKSPRVDVMQVGLLMPFLDKSEGQAARIQEYYEGFLLAVEKLKKEGANMELYVFDIGTEENTKKLESLLTTMEMQNLDLVIGGVSDNQIKILSDFSKAKNIKYVIPFSSKNNEVLNNGHIFQVNTPQAKLYSKASQVFVNRFSHSNVVFLNTNEDDKKDDLIHTMKTDLSDRSIRYQSLPINDDMSEALLELLDETKQNILIPASGDIGVLGQVLETLNELKELHPEIDIDLFGYPEWQTYEQNYLRDYHNHGTFLYSSFYVDKGAEETKQFQKNFREWYDKKPNNTYPQYGMLGYDTGLYFLTALNRYGRDFENSLNRVDVKTVQFAFDFQRVNNWGGFINTGMYLVNYDTDSRIKKIRADR